MPPRKVDKKPINNGEPKILRSRKKKNNGEVNIPEIQVTIPQNQQNILNGFGNQLKNENSMPVENNIKIMLANEVVRRQFPKNKSLLEKPNGLISKVKINKTIKKSPLLGRQKLLKTNKMSDISGKNLQTKCVRKAAAKNNSIVINTEQLEIAKEIAPDEKAKETEKPRVKLRRNRIQNSGSADTFGSQTTNSLEVTGDKQSEVKTQITSPNAVIKRKPGPRSGPRTRKKTNDEAKKNENTEIATSDSKNKITDTEVLLNPRRLSLAGSELSWTKDISSSSTSTCVTVSSKDFFRIDNKIPFIKLTNIDKQLGNYENDNAKEHNDVDRELQSVKASDIQLSSSSSSSSSSDQESCNNVQITPPISTLDKLASKLKNFDLEIMNWVGSNCSEKNASNDLTNIQDKIVNNKFLQEERDVILHCQSIKRILSEYSFINENEKENSDNNIEINVESNINISDNTKETTVEKSEQSIGNFEIKSSQLEDKAHNNTFNDEDDALSLYAESITDMESPRNWKQKSRENIEEYVPLPTKDDVFKRPEKVIYKPTKIKNLMLKEAENAIEIGICEKSNADSTSTYKDNNESASEENINFYEDRLGEVEKTLENPVQIESILMGINQKPKQGIHSALFKGICIFNLTSNCKNKICKFPHKVLDKDDIRLRLRTLDTPLFQEEYMFVRAWTSLRRLYGICFVEDCIRRRLTRVLIEMTLDLLNKSHNKEDSVLGVNAVETTLVYLNDIELHTYDDLLKHKVKNNRLLCDTFLDTIAKSQNFSRFKTIFINLTNFMCDIECTFESDMASHVLERVCILPFDYNLAQALIKVIRNTDLNIFNNSMMKMFEQRLLISSAKLYKEFCALKDDNSNSLRDGNCYNSPLDSDSERLNNPGYSENDIRYSPDTTNLDNFTKTPIEPKFKRTVDLNKLKVVNHLPNSSSSESDDKYTHRHYKTWNNNRKSYNRPSLNRNVVKGRNPNMRPPLRPAFKRRSDQIFGSSPSKFPRRSGPTYF